VPPWALVAAAVVLVVVIGVVGYWWWAGRSGSGSFEQGMADYQAGRREAAVGDFNKAVREDPKNPRPHVYLARMAREVKNYQLATQELQLALQADPNYSVALREMGANLLEQGNYDLARKFYVRAVTADPTDKLAMGYLGCTLMRLGRTSEAPTWLNRAGPGPWSTCTPASGPAPATSQLLVPNSGTPIPRP
jgi:tetratricopeptide (TPR) repeat protein